jgi:hypothetical protein
MWRKFRRVIIQDRKMKLLKLFVLFCSVGLIAQTPIKDVNQLLVFSPDDNSKNLNEVYTQNFFFGNFGIKPLINAIPINNSKVKTIKISAEKSGKKTPNVMELTYDKTGLIQKLNVSEMLAGNKREVTYVYQDGLIAEEKFKDGKQNKVNKFHYAEGKMIIQTFKGLTEVYELKGNVFTKQSFMEGKPVFKDRIEGKCRVTTYLKEDIDKICYSNFESEFPLMMEEFVNSYDAKSKKTVLVPENKWELKKIDDSSYSVLRDGKENYKIKLDKDKRVKTFEYLGSKSENLKPVVYTFTYTYH